MTHYSEILEDEDDEYQECRGCQVFGVPHIQEKRLDWSDMDDNSEDAYDSNDSDETITQESYLESYMASQMRRAEEEEQQKQVSRSLKQSWTKRDSEAGVADVAVVQPHLNGSLRASSSSSVQHHHYPASCIVHHHDQLNSIAGLKLTYSLAPQHSR